MLFRSLPHQQLLPIHETPDRVHLDARRQDDAPAAEAFGHALGADVRQRRAQAAVVAGDLELDEGAVRPPLYLEIAVIDRKSVARTAASSSSR